MRAVAPNLVPVSRPLLHSPSWRDASFIKLGDSFPLRALTAMCFLKRSKCIKKKVMEDKKNDIGNTSVPI
jgi:hypothetical protein